MHRIDTPTNVSTLPTAAALGTNGEGFFTKGNTNSGGSIPPTNFDQDWANMVQEELAAIVAAAGITRVKGVYNQSITAIQDLIAAAVAAVVTVPTGTVLLFSGTSAPSGFVVRNGALLSRASYPALWTFAQASGNIVADGSWDKGMYSTGDGSTTFRIPDGRGEFDRGYDNGAGVDPSRAFGSSQADGVISHTHSVVINPGNSVNVTTSGSTLVPTYFAGVTGAYGGSETRPKNVAYLPILKY